MIDDDHPIPNNVRYFFNQDFVRSFNKFCVYLQQCECFNTDLELFMASAWWYHSEHGTYRQIKCVFFIPQSYSGKKKWYKNSEAPGYNDDFSMF